MCKPAEGKKSSQAFEREDPLFLAEASKQRYKQA